MLANITKHIASIEAEAESLRNTSDDNVQETESACKAARLNMTSVSSSVDKNDLQSRI